MVKKNEQFLYNSVLHNLSNPRRFKALLTLPSEKKTMCLRTGEPKALESHINSNCGGSIVKKFGACKGINRLSVFFSYSYNPPVVSKTSFSSQWEAQAVQFGGGDIH